MWFRGWGAVTTKVQSNLSFGLDRRKPGAKSRKSAGLRDLEVEWGVRRSVRGQPIWGVINKQENYLYAFQWNKMLYLWMIWPRGSMHFEKRMWPRVELCGTPQERLVEGEGNSSMERSFYFLGKMWISSMKGHQHQPHTEDSLLKCPDPQYWVMHCGQEEWGWHSHWSRQNEG